MLLRKSIKEGLVVLLIYSIITLCLFMCADRIERLDMIEKNTQTISVSK